MGGEEEDAADYFSGDAPQRGFTASELEREHNEHLEEMALRRTEEDVARMSIIKGQHPAAEQGVVIKEEPHDSNEADGMVDVDIKEEPDLVDIKTEDVEDTFGGVRNHARSSDTKSHRKQLKAAQNAEHDSMMRSLFVTDSAVLSQVTKTAQFRHSVRS